MILLAGFPDLDSSPLAMTDASRRAPDRERGMRNQALASPGESCLRCGGLLVPSDLASLESNVTGRPMRLRCCVNCGDCVDSYILANRWKGPSISRQSHDPMVPSWCQTYLTHHDSC
jgi:hypothetical protein